MKFEDKGYGIIMSYGASFLEMQPSSVIGTVLSELCAVTGSRGIINRADIPVLMRYANHLACASKTLHCNVNHCDATNLFLNAMAHKYDRSCEHFAAFLNTIGARKWLWNYIHLRGDDKNYQIICEIKELAAVVLAEAKKADLPFNYLGNPRICERPKSNDFQTIDGFIFYNYWSPNYLATPFGEIEIFEECYSRTNNSHLSVSEVFIKRLNAVFDLALSRYKNDAKEFYAIVPSIDHKIRKISYEEMKIIPRENLECQNGMQDLIVAASWENYGAYKIREVNGKKVANVKWPDISQPARNAKVIDRIWDMLEANRLGQDPIEKKIIKSPSGLHLKKPNKIYFKNIQEFSQRAIEIVTELDQQNIFENSYLLESYKRLILNVRKLSYTIKKLNDAAKRFLDPGTKWKITPLYGLCLLNGKPFDIGLQLVIQGDRERCNLATLGRAYKLVAKNIGLNWMKGELKDHPNALGKYSEEDYVLFVKQFCSSPREDALISCIASQIGLSKFIHFSDSNSKHSYLWIKKDKLERSLEALNIKLM